MIIAGKKRQIEQKLNNKTMELPIRTITLKNTEDGHSRIWQCELFEDKCVTHWGKIGYELNSKQFPGEGIEFFEKKLKEKLKKGYTLSLTSR